jgi:hypothetical protein
MKQMSAQARATHIAMTEKQARWFMFLVAKYGNDDDDC